ncbi:MAG: hypothetical protein Q9182_004752 [Xanthomendoza sp. 2 TL-2023]
MEPQDSPPRPGALTSSASTIGNSEYQKLDIASHTRSTAASGMSEVTTLQAPASRSRNASGKALIDDTDPVTTSITSNLESINLNTDTKPDQSLTTCTAPDCPLKDTIHNKGLFLHEATLGFGVRFHPDFGYSNPPPFLWAAYFRYTRNLDELRDYCRSNGSVEIHCNSPLERLGPDDAARLLGFLRCHAVTLRWAGKGLMEVPMRGKILRGEESSMVVDMDALTI